ncbi:MAG: 1-acyl-sn-glycerol-3-phosphate acyltransferase [Negativicutes bacterium]|nr:1-acyl-sn-glycerol-3-phosphate acyltransferase [Negativicutes bacterium]
MYNFLRGLVRFLLRLFFRWEYQGAENIPASGPTLVASNHLSFWDPPVIGCALQRPIHYMAKEELFKVPGFGWLIRQLNAFPVKRGAADRSAIRTALSLLENGAVVGVFPEGTRSKTGALGKAEPGLALIAAKAGAVIVPAAVTGTNRFLKNGGGLFPKFKVKFGRPIYVKPGQTDKEYLEQLTNEMMSEIDRLLREA